MIYYTSDLHLGHKNVLKYDNRPFATIDEMNREIIARWNAKVKDEDHVYILGDFAYRTAQDPSYYLKQLKGRKHLVRGNHDKITVESKSAHKYLESIEGIQHIKDGDRNVVLSHFPIAEWNAMKRGAYHIYGHIHARKDDTYRFMSTREHALNAGCMINGYEPVSLEELIINNEKHKVSGKREVLQ